jgi:hypothetical protein
VLDDLVGGLARCVIAELDPLPPRWDAQGLGGGVVRQGKLGTVAVVDRTQAPTPHNRGRVEGA